MVSFSASFAVPLRGGSAHGRGGSTLGFDLQGCEDAIDATPKSVAAVLSKDAWDETSKRFGGACQCAAINRLEAEHVDSVDPHRLPRPAYFMGCLHHLEGRDQRRRPGLPAEGGTGLESAVKGHRLHVGVPCRPSGQVDHHGPHRLRRRRNANLAFRRGGCVAIDVHAVTVLRSPDPFPRRPTRQLMVYADAPARTMKGEGITCRRRSFSKRWC
jgi:hypothetical protein